MLKDIKKIFSCIGEYKKYAMITPFLIVCSVVTEVSLPYLMAKVIDNGINLGFGSKYVIKIGTIMLVLVLFSLICEVLAVKFAAIASSGFEKNLRKKIFITVENFSQANIDKFMTSTLITRMTTDITSIKDAFLGLLRGSIRAPLMLTGALIMSVLTEPKLSFIFFFSMPALLLIRFLIMRVAHPKFMALLKCYDGLNLDTQEDMTNIRTIKAFVKEKDSIEQFNNNVAETRKMQISAEKLMMLNMPAMQSIMYIGMILILWFGGLMVVNKEMSVGELSSFITYSTQAVGALMMVSVIFMMFIRSRASLDRISEVLNEEIDIKDSKLENIDFNDGSIEFKDVCFSYKGSENTLEKINLEIKSGETIGIIGGTGSGKSTLAKLMVRFYDITDGQLIIGGNNIKNYKLDILRKNVNYVPQKSLLFSGTIKSNLLWGNENATEEDMEKACKIAEAYGFIMSFPDKYDSIIGQSGVNVSGGQRQRLCIARAILREPKILIFDDSLSAIDTVTESKIKKSLTETLSNTTKIIITQKISSIINADKIVVLDSGKISGIGTHGELVNNNAIYKEIYELQLNTIGYKNV